MEINQESAASADEPNSVSSSYNYARANKVITELDIQVAAILVQDAKAERNTKFKRDEKSVRAYQLYRLNVFKIMQFLCIWGNMSLALFEKPGIYELPCWASMLVEFVFLMYFLFRFFHNLYFTANENFLRDPKNVTVMLSIFLISIDMICYAIWTEIGRGAVRPVRWSRVLRPLFFINFPEGRQVRKAFRSIRRTLLDIAHGFFLLLASIALFSLMALKLFEMRDLTYPDGTPYFQNYFDIFWELYVLVTTSNSPDVIMPAYNASRFYAFFFVCFLLVNLYIFMSIVLAIVFYNYKKHLKGEVMTSVYRKRKLLGESFNIISEPSEFGKVVTKERFLQLLRVAFPNKSNIYFEVVCCVLDPEGQGCITKAEFLKLTDVLTILLIESKEYVTWFKRKIPDCYNSVLSAFVRKVVQHRFFRFGFDFAIIVNTICIAMNWDQVEWFFLTIFCLEILLKIYTYGSIQFFKNMWDVFDFVIVLSALVVTIYESASGNFEETEILSLDFILVLRVLRLVRLLMGSKTFRVILTTIVNIGPSIVTYGCVFFVVDYIYAIIGMEIFGGLIKKNGTEYCGNPALNNSEFLRLDYCNNNFNDLPRAFVTLFELMVVNQWHVLANGFVLLTNKGARIYFFSYNVVGVVVLLNIITAFVLEAFMLEYTVSRKDQLRDALMNTVQKLGLTKDQVIASGVEAKQDSSIPDSPPNATKIDAESNVTEFEGGKTYFTLSDHGFKKIEVVMQEMFQEQIDPSDNGPNSDSDESDLEVSEFKQFDYMRI